jgi:uncharacterized protein
MIVTADANIYISALQFQGRAQLLVDLALEERIELAISTAIMAEIERVLTLKFAWPPQRLEESMRFLAHLARRIDPPSRLDVVAADPTDNRIIECAVASGSACIVTGDRHLLSIGSYGGVRVITLKELLAEFGIG